MLYRFILQSIWDWRVMQVKSLLYFVIFSVSLCQRKFNSWDFLLSYLDLEQFWLFYPSVKWRRWTTLLWVDACSTKIPSHYDMAVQNHQATNCGTAKGHIHKLHYDPLMMQQKEARRKHTCVLPKKVAFEVWVPNSTLIGNDGCYLHASCMLPACFLRASFYTATAGAGLTST